MTSRIAIAITLTVWSACALAVSPETDSAKRLPAEIRLFLDQKYSGWTFSPARDKEITGCGKEERQHPSIAFGDFNGDGTEDVAIKIVQGSKVHLLEVLSRANGGFNENLLFRGAVRKLSDTALQVERKGKPTVVGTVELVDSLLVSDCQSIPLRFLFHKGKVRNVTPSE